MAQRFYNLVLLPRIRDDIAEYKRLNFHLYMALKKALFKPAAWFKGRGSCRVSSGAWLGTRGAVAWQGPRTLQEWWFPGIREKGLSAGALPVDEGGWCLTVPVPRDPHPAVRVRHVHAQGGRHHRQHPHQVLHPRPALQVRP